MSIDAKKAARTGLLTILVVFGGLGGWMITAPLHGAVVVGGIVKVASSRKTIQHSEGGIIGKILVDDGDSVKRGDTLIQLEDAAVTAQYNMVRSELDAEMARQARLHAEATMQPTIEFPTELRERIGETAVAELTSREQALFAANRSALEQQARLINDQIKQIDREIVALAGQRQSGQKAKAIAVQELDSYLELEKKQYTAKLQRLAQERLVNDYESRSQENEAESARARQRIQDLKLRSAALRDAYLSRAAEDLKESGVKVQGLRERLLPSIDALRRQAIVAPVAGTIIGLRVHTEGSTIGPREPLMDIVPNNDALIIEAQAPLNAIKELHLGQRADIRFSALPYRTTPMVTGVVSYISSDALADQQGHPFFQVQIKPDVDSLREANIVALDPGMSAEVYIQTQARTAMDYILKPITDTVRRSFRER